MIKEITTEPKEVTFGVYGDAAVFNSPFYVLAAHARIDGNDFLYDRIGVFEFLGSPTGPRNRWLLVFSTEDVAREYLNRIPSDDSRDGVAPFRITNEQEKARVINSVMKNDLTSTVVVDTNPEQAQHLGRIIERGGEWKGPRWPAK
jgi:hypothetical protein